MPSPFPGMDPYLEPHWPDIQTGMVAHAVGTLNRWLPDDLVARASEREAIEEEPAGRFASIEPTTERSIHILDFAQDRRVTVIEFVSPANKLGKGLKEFVRGREDLLASGVNVVEIDLTRTGDWIELLKPFACPERAVSLYRGVVRDVERPGRMELYPFPLREPLPVVKIPLRPGETPASLPLGPLVRHAYDSGRYARTLDYNKPAVPPLEGEDAEWADRLLREAVRRK